jgi:hypothetical protein
MEWIVILAIFVVVVALVRNNNQRQLKVQQTVMRRGLDQLTAVKTAAEEDITVLGEELQRLDIDVAGHELDEGARADYQRALAAYEAAKQSLASVSTTEEIGNVTGILDDGRYAIACVRARVAGEPVPARRPPCFFNPQHGPSVRDVSWSPPGGVERDVPACALDAERVDAGADPDSRRVMLGARRVPYWEAGSAFGPFAAGYFGAFGVMNVLFMGTMMGAVLGGTDGSYSDGYDDGRDDASDSDDSGDGGDSGGDASGSDYDASGGYDSGGYDSGGYDGGGDFGGGDFGGGDFGGGF